MATTTKQRKRKHNFSQEEIGALLSFLQQHASKLSSRAGHCSAKIEKSRKKCWLMATEVLQAAGGPARTWREIKAKWVHLKRKALQYKMILDERGEGSVPFHHVHEAILAILATVQAEPIISSSSEEDEMAPALFDDTSDGSWLQGPVEESPVRCKTEESGINSATPSVIPRESAPMPPSQASAARKVPTLEDCHYLIQEQTYILREISNKLDIVISKLK
ncbi:uncharacterized protein [Diadema setosum]|uniref:uncharacterized protein n=1 Tax=Diadema setosum TaxID=31175 RepID=UPI003B3B85B8